MSKSRQALVSVIIPVYNVIEWLDMCLESVIRQTFEYFEVLLINDGSTDGSDLKCLEWEKKDQRIKVISKANEGPSVARNCGIRNARGEYLVFIDADDWIDSTFLEKLYQAVQINNTTISECDVYRYNNITNEATYRNCAGNLGIPYTLEEHMKYGYTAIWKCMIKKTLFLDNGIMFPDCHSEARAVYPLLLAASGSITNVSEGLYYYRKFRRGSLSEKPKNNREEETSIGLKAFDALLSGFKMCGLYEEYENVLYEIIKLKLSDLLAGLFYRRNKDYFLELTEKYYLYIKEKFPESSDFHYISWGGYNLNRILIHMNVLHNPYGRFNFSSLISMMNPVSEIGQYTHKNKYREIMINRDINSLLWMVMEDIKPEYFFIDFVEERFDILEYQGGYITKSDAFDEIQNEFADFRKIERNSEECQNLWESSIQEFMEKLKDKHPGCKVIVLENYLSEIVGDIHERKYFNNIQEIQNTNLILKQYYDFIRDNYSSVPIIRAYECDNYFTDKDYEYGAVPSHLNELVNFKIAKLTEAVVGIKNV